MEDTNKNGQQDMSNGGDFFDNLMFGPQRRQEDSLQSQPAEKNQTYNKTIDNLNTPETQNEHPQLDFVQMMQQFDSLMGYVNKLGPSLKKMGPLFDLFKGFNNKK